MVKIHGHTNVGANLLAARQKSGLTQKQLGSFINLDQPTLSRLEKRRLDPTSAMLDDIETAARGNADGLAAKKADAGWFAATALTAPVVDFASMIGLTPAGGRDDAVEPRSGGAAELRCLRDSAIDSHERLHGAYVGVRMTRDARSPFVIEVLWIESREGRVVGRLMRTFPGRRVEREHHAYVFHTGYNLVMVHEPTKGERDFAAIMFEPNREDPCMSLYGIGLFLSDTSPPDQMAVKVAFHRHPEEGMTWERLKEWGKKLGKSERQAVWHRYQQEMRARTHLVLLDPASALLEGAYSR